MSISQLFPEEAPTLNLNFAGSKILDPRITFTRTSSGTRTNSQGLIEVVPANYPRFDHRYVNGEIESLGLLVEESRVNYALRSQEFNTSPNSAVNASISPNAAIAPDGTLTADKLVEDNILSQFKRIQQGGFSTNGSYTVSVFVKAAGRTKGYIQLLNTTNAAAFFNLATGQITGGTGTRGIIPYPNGWYRVWASNTYTNETPTVYIVLVNDSDQSNYTGDGSSGLFLWGLQVEPGAFPTSYIPTSGSTVTRTADNASMTGTNFSNWYNQTEGTLFTQYKTIGDKSNQMVAQIRSDDGNNRVEIRAQGSSSSQFRIEVINNGAATQQEFTITPSGYTVNNFHKITLGYKENNFASTINGTLYTDNTGVVGNCNYMMIGAANYGSSGDYNGHISQLIYYPTRLPNSQLISLTR
jgi:hypothetical protein